MECENNNNDPINREIINQYDTLQKIVAELRFANFSNDEGSIICNPAFIKLEEMAKAQQGEHQNAIPEEVEHTEKRMPEEPFHIEADIYDTGDYATLLVIPSADTFIVVDNNEHLVTLVNTCPGQACWEQLEGGLDDDLVELIGQQISAYVEAL
jgi:hypothetical protein